MVFTWSMCENFFWNNNPNIVLLLIQKDCFLPLFF